MSEILGKVTGPIEVPRGADVSLRICVPKSWLLDGGAIEVELPRHLTCASCHGGGCGICCNSGAITLRARGELPEAIRVNLPEQSRIDVQPQKSGMDVERDPVFSSIGDVGPRNARPVTIRIPECGGLPEPGSGNVRGWLLLEVCIAETPSSHVRLLDDEDPLSSAQVLRAEVERAALAEPSSSKSEIVMVSRGSSRRSALPPVPEANGVPTSVVEQPKSWLIQTLGTSPAIRVLLALLVVAIGALWMWYWR